MALDEFTDFLTPADPVGSLDAISPIVDSGVPEAANASSGGLLAGLQEWAKANPQLAGSLFGAAGPLAGLLGTLASGGISGTQAGKTNSSTNSVTNQTSQSNQQNNASGFSNTNTQGTIDPAAQAAENRLTGMLDASAPGAQGAYNQGLSMLQQLASGQMGKMNAGTGATAIGAPNTTPNAAPVTGFPTAPPTAYNAGLGNLIKQAFGSFVGDLGSQAITNARGRGFAGGGDLLGSAASPMMGQSLAQVPAMESKAYLDHVLQAYDLESQNAARSNAAGAASLNAATNALGPGVTKYGMDVSKYGIDRTADNNQLGQMTSLLQALMGPQNNLMTGNTNLLNSAPRGSTSSNLTGSQSNQSLSGTQQSNSQSQTQGATSGTTGTPLPNAVGQGVANVIGGAGQGAVAGSPVAAANQATLLKLLGQQ